MRERLLAPAVLVILAAGACGGSGPGPSEEPTPATASATTPTPEADPDIVGLFRACHRTRQGSLILVFLFEDRDPARAQEGATTFAVTPRSPTTWTTSGDRVLVAPGYNEHVRQVEVPPDEPAPSEMTLRVAVETTATGQILATNDVTIGLPTCASA